MSINSICKRRVATVGRDVDVGVAARMMRDEHVGCLIVTSSPGKRPIGILTDRDIVLNVIARGRNPAEITVGEVMTPDPLVTELSADIGETLKRMREIGVRRTPVVDSQGQLAGIVALDDIVEHLLEEMTDVAGAIRTEQRTERALRS